ncbi:MAG: aldehyde dehydrogenase family protein [Thermoplasmatota archaeon]
MPFTNENTWLRASASKDGVDRFHAEYEAAVKRVRGTLGRSHPLKIGVRDVSTSATFTSTNPGNTDEVIGTFSKGAKEHVDQAVAAGRAAQPAWEALGWEKRAAIFERAGDAMAARKYDLAALMTLENGKNRVEAMYDVDEATDFLRYYAWRLREEKGFVRPMGKAFPEEECVSVMRPWGVFAVIGPFNFPLAIPTGMTTGALITGNATVVKPASDTPAMAYELYDILVKAGVPAGVINLVTGGGAEVGQTLIDHAGIDGIVFTGSRDVGTKNYGSFVTRRPRPYICEMGGKNAIVVTAKADLAKAADGVSRSAFGFGGQKCSAASRCYIHSSVYDQFVPMLVERARGLAVGLAEEKTTDVGPVITAKAVRTFEDAVAAATNAGGKVLAGGKTVKEGRLAKGHFVQPTVVSDLPAGHEALRTEYFVPFLAIAKYGEFDAVLREVNAVDYGLTSGIFSEDPQEVATFFDRVEAGVVYANRRRGGSTGAMVGAQSFGGWKFSATTDRGAGGPHYLEQFMREQSRTIAK